jgi:ubiquinone/menaquinone biosynthesis C-methylase UbiE
MAADLRDTLAGAPSGHVVDIGAGPGGLVAALAPSMPTSRFTIVDVDAAMVALARERMARDGLASRVTAVVGDVTALPLPDSSADVVISSFSVHHWPDAATGFEQVRRVLKPGGRVIVYDLPDWWGRFETKAPSLAVAARGGGLADARLGWLAWPSSVRAVRRLEAIV